MAGQVLFYDGHFYQDEEIPEALLDRGLFFGDGVFESMIVWKGRILGLPYHIDRLFRGLEVLKISHSWKENDIKNRIKETTNFFQEAAVYIRLSVTRGRWLGSIPPFGEIRPHLLMVGRKYLPFREEIFEKGYRTLTLTTCRNETSPLVNIKSLNYLDNILGRMTALEKGFDEGIFLNSQGKVCEGTASNLFLIRDNQLLTPPKEDGVLEGVTRRLILDAAFQAKLKAQMRSLSPEEVLGADEAFLTNAQMGVIPWVQSDGKNIGTGHPGPKTTGLRQIYENLKKTSAENYGVSDPE